MTARRTPTSDDLRRSLLKILTAAQAVVVLIAIGALLGGIAAVVDDRKAVGLTLTACGLAAVVVAYAVLSYLQWRVTVADEQATVATAALGRSPTTEARPGA